MSRGPDPSIPTAREQDEWSGGDDEELPETCASCGRKAESLCLACYRHVCDRKGCLVRHDACHTDDEDIPEELPRLARGTAPMNRALEIAYRLATLYLCAAALGFVMCDPSSSGPERQHPADLAVCVRLVDAGADAGHGWGCAENREEPPQ